VGEVVTVPGMTEDELREIAIDASLDALDDDRELLLLQADEFTLEQWRIKYNERYGVKITDTTARRKLRRLIDRGVVEEEDRKNPVTGLGVKGYRYVEGKN